VYLLDVNTLIALTWDGHEHFQAAHGWFSSRSQQGFATCHVTQSGFLRLSLNPKVVRCQIGIADALAKLNSLTSQTPHRFWADGPVEAESPVWNSVTGHSQVTDTNLFLIARRHNGVLVTFDGAIRNHLPTQHRQWVEVIEG
jgi:uncharacterized protein